MDKISLANALRGTATFRAIYKGGSREGLTRDFMVLRVYADRKRESVRGFVVYDRQAQGLRNYLVKKLQFIAYLHPSTISMQKVSEVLRADHQEIKNYPVVWRYEHQSDLSELEGSRIRLPITAPLPIFKTDFSHRSQYRDYALEAVKDSAPSVPQITEEILKAYGLWGERAYAIVGVVASHLLHVGADEVIKMWDDMYAQYYVPYVLRDK